MHKHWIFSVHGKLRVLQTSYRNILRLAIEYTEVSFYDWAADFVTDVQYRLSWIEENVGHIGSICEIITSFSGHHARSISRCQNLNIRKLETFFLFFFFFGDVAIWIFGGITTNDHPQNHLVKNSRYVDVMSYVLWKSIMQNEFFIYSTCWGITNRKLLVYYLLNHPCILCTSSKTAQKTA